MIYRFSLLLFAFIFFNKPLPNRESNTYKLTSTDSSWSTKNRDSNILAKSKSFYSLIDSNGYSLPSFVSFFAAFEGYNQLLQLGKIKNEMLTIVDFSLSSTQDRMWVIDMKLKKVVLNSLVAHGKNSGNEYATDFSNKHESYKSSLGFFITGETYLGKHGLSLRLDGMEYGINDNARNRAVVIHGAEYVSENFIKKTGRLGRSQGCPSVSYEIHKKLIETIKEKSCIFIYHPSRAYIQKFKQVL